MKRSCVFLGLLLLSLTGAGTDFEVREYFRLRYADGTEVSSEELPPPEIRQEKNTQIRHYRSGSLEVELRLLRGHDGSLRCQPILMKTPRPVEFLGAPSSVSFQVGKGKSVFLSASLGTELRDSFFHTPHPGMAPWKYAEKISVKMPGVEVISSKLGIYEKHKAFSLLLRSRPGIRKIGRLCSFLAVEGLETRHNHLTGTVHSTNPGIEVIPLQNMDDFLRGLCECDMIVNMLPGALPSPAPGRAEETAALIRRFLARGGCWVEFSGAKPFSRLLVPDLQLRKFSVSYPNRGEGTADFSAVGDAEKEITAFYGVQQKNPGVFDPSLPHDRYVCGSVTEIVPQGNGKALWKHLFQSYAPPGKIFRFPETVIAPYSSLRSAVLEYGKANRIGKELKEKVSPELLERWKRALFMKINDKRARISAWEKIIASKPFDSPVLYHHIEWVHDKGVFDQYYPDYFPYDPALGNEKDLRKLYRTAVSKGDLAMPYTQPVFWDLSPERMENRLLSESIMRKANAGNDVRTFLSSLMTRDASGKPYMIGGILFHASPWDPLVREIDKCNYRKFVHELGAPLYFHDSIGAEPYRNDFSSHVPSPNAHLHGMLALAELEHSYGKTPLATDEGFDLLSGPYSMLCGMTFLSIPSSWGIFHPYKERFAKGSCRLFPFLEFLLHDKVLMTGHNSGTSVFHRGGISFYAVTGLSLQTTVRIPALLEDLKQPGGGWNRVLAAYQNVLGPLTGGKKLLSLRYPDEDVLESRWEGNITITGNLRTIPYGKIAPYGFLAEKEGRPAAGIVLENGKIKFFAGEKQLFPPDLQSAFETF